MLDTKTILICDEYLWDVVQSKGPGGGNLISNSFVSKRIRDKQILRIPKSFYCYNFLCYELFMTFGVHYLTSF